MCASRPSYRLYGIASDRDRNCRNAGNFRPADPPPPLWQQHIHSPWPGYSGSSSMINRKRVARRDGDRMRQLWGSMKWLPVAQISAAKWSKESRKGVPGEEGSSTLEMALCCAVFLSLLFGVIQFCFALYVSNVVSEAARDATRYAVVRGSNSCTISSSFPDCNLSPSSPGNPIQDYLRRRAYPGIVASKLTATPTWWNVTTTNAGGGAYSTSTWTTQCTTGTTCNLKRNAVQVVVQYPYSLNIPFWKNVNLNLTSTSRMVISE